MRLFLIVVEDARSEVDAPEALESYLRALLEEPGSGLTVKAVRRGGLLALKVLEELPPVRHVHMGRPRGLHS